MKKLIYFLITIPMIMGIASCSKSNDNLQKWEYKTIIIYGEAKNNFSSMRFGDHGNGLDTLGAKGWELVDVCTEVGTVHPNYGNDKYVTGLQPNVRTTVFYYYFKRPIINGVEKDSVSVIITVP